MFHRTKPIFSILLGPPEVRWPVPNWDAAPSPSGPSTVPETSQVAELLSDPNMYKQIRRNNTAIRRKELWDGKRPEQQKVGRALIGESFSGSKQPSLPSQHGDRGAGTKDPHEQPTNL